MKSCRLCILLTLLTLIPIAVSAQGSSRDEPPASWPMTSWPFQLLRDLRDAGLVEKSYPMLGDSFFVSRRSLTRFEMAIWISRLLQKLDAFQRGAPLKPTTPEDTVVPHLTVQNYVSIKRLTTQFRKELNELGAIGTPFSSLHYQDKLGRTSLHWAAFEGKTAILEDLYTKGVKLEARDHAGWTPLMDAAVCGNEAAVKSLLERGANANAATKEGVTPLMWAVSSWKPENTNIVEALLKHGAKVDAQAENGQTALEMAKKAGCTATVALLEKAGAK